MVKHLHFERSKIQCDVSWGPRPQRIHSRMYPLCHYSVRLRPDVRLPGDLVTVRCLLTRHDPALSAVCGGGDLTCVCLVTVHFTETALSVVTDKVLKAMDNSEISILVLLDLSKCFDVVPHSKLLEKMTQYGIDTTWFSSYLSGHTQQVQVRTLSGQTITSEPRENAPDMSIFQGVVSLVSSIFCSPMT